MKIKNIIAIVLILITLFTTLGIFSNTSKAATYIIDEADLYSKGELVCFSYQDMVVGVQFVVYQKDGVEYPAYCLNRNLPGVTEEESYTVSADKLVTDSKIWRVITNGYPYHSAKELGCNSDIEAFAATKMAVYDAMHNYDWNDFKALDEQGSRIIAVAQKIAKVASSSTASKPVSIVEIKTNDSKWEMDKIDKNFASKTFYVTTNVDSTNYNVKLSNVKIDNVKITDEKNNEKTEFKTGEKFKVLIPISEMDKRGNFDLEVTANMKTMPILYGNSGNSTKQNYALVAGDYEFESSKLRVTYLDNTTKIEILKKDAETGEPLKGAKFNILDENKNIVYSDLETNKEGLAKVEGINPGKYYIQEIKSPDGYTTYEELIEVNLLLNQIYRVNVNDYKKPEDEEKKVEDEDKTITGIKEENLPRTGF